MKTDNRILDIIAYISFHALISSIVLMVYISNKPVFDKNLLRDGCSLNYFNNETEKTGYELTNPNKRIYSKTVLLICNSPFIQQ